MSAVRCAPGGDEPVFMKSEAPRYPGGPILRTELASPQMARLPAEELKWLTTCSAFLRSDERTTIEEMVMNPHDFKRTSDRAGATKPAEAGGQHGDRPSSASR